jgi:hypothetical protein
MTDEQIAALRKASAVLCGTGYHDEASVINGLLATPAPLSDEPVAVECRKCFRCGHDAHLGQCVNVAPTPSDKQEAVNGIPATLRHDEGAIARCSYCGRYSLDPKTLSNRQPKCDCGEQHGWSGSFKKPGPDSKWSGAAPLAQSAEQDRIDAERYRHIRKMLDPLFSAEEYDANIDAAIKGASK